MPEKWTVPKESLEVALSLVENVPTRNSVKSSEFIRFSRAKEGAVLSLCSDSGARAIVIAGSKLPADEVFIDRRLFSPFINLGKDLTATDYHFLFDTDVVVIKHGYRKATYQLHKSITGYDEPSLDKSHTTAVLKKWTSVVDCAANCATDDPTVPSLNCVYITQGKKGLDILSTNQRVAFLGKVATDKKPLKENIAFPLLLVKALKLESALKVHWTNKLAVIEYPRGKIWSAVKSEARKHFPEKDVRNSIKSALETPIVAGVSSDAFVVAVDRIAKCLSVLASDDLGLEIKLVKGSKKILISAGPAESKFTETVVGLTDAKEDLVLEWPMLDVLPVILYSKDEGAIKIHYSNKKNTSCIATKNLCLVVVGRSK